MSKADEGRKSRMLSILVIRGSLHQWSVHWFVIFEVIKAKMQSLVKLVISKRRNAFPDVLPRNLILGTFIQTTRQNGLLTKLLDCHSFNTFNTFKRQRNGRPSCPTKLFVCVHDFTEPSTPCLVSLSVRATDTWFCDRPETNGIKGLNNRSSLSTPQVTALLWASVSVFFPRNFNLEQSTEMTQPPPQPQWSASHPALLHHGQKTPHPTPAHLLARSVVLLYINPFPLLSQGLNLGPCVHWASGPLPGSSTDSLKSKLFVYMAFKFKLGWGGGLVGEALGAQAWGPDIRSPEPAHRRPGKQCTSGIPTLLEDRRQKETVLQACAEKWGQIPKSALWPSHAKMAGAPLH